MSLSSRSKRMVVCPFGVCLGDQWCPHAVQVALATDRVGAQGRDGGGTMSQNVIASWEAVAKAVEGLSMLRGGCHGARNSIPMFQVPMAGTHSCK